ncbi:MAG: HEPN domain-containing protein [Bacteroides sp.]|nr:HEPN domain-containing protein [Bacteroides sp.]
MSLSEEERTILVQHEIEKAYNTLAQVAVLQQAGFWDRVANRLYYAAFHSVNALLIKNGHYVRTHHGANAVFQQLFIKTGILPKETSELYSILQTMREKSDYNCSFGATQSIIEPLIEPTRELLDKIKILLS